MTKRKSTALHAVTGSVITPFSRGKQTKDLRTHLDGPSLLGRLDTHLRALDKLDEELENSIQEFTRDVFNAEGEVIAEEQYTSTSLDKETIGVYHTRMNARKIQIDTALKMLNKVLPDLKAIETLDDIATASDRALKAFAEAARRE